MSGDLVSIQMLLVSGAGPAREVWQQGVAQVSVPVQLETADGRLGVAALGKGGVDICIVDYRLPKTEIDGVITAARAARPQPFVVVVAPRGTARVDGVDAMVPKPGNAVEARKLAEICVRARIPVRTLVVDDSVTVRSIVRKILLASRFALDVHEASEGVAALEQLRSGNFGMVFLDYNMPRLNGFETLSEIRRENPNVAVVMITSTDDYTLAERAYKAGALGFLKKPFYPADVDAVLERYHGLQGAMG